MFTPLLIAARAVNIGASILLAGIFTFDAIMFLPGGRVGTGDFQEVERRLLRLAVWSLIAAILSALIWLCRAQVKARRALILILWLLSVVFLASLALISHAAAASIQPLGLLGDMLHLCAVGGWIGVLLPLVIFLARTRASLALGEIA